MECSGSVCTGKGGAAVPIQADNVVFRLPAGRGIHLWYHLPFTTGTVEHTLHRQTLVERLHLMHQLCDINLTAEE
jgi:hypothetical protein